jgi:hypothetical protein
MVFRNPCAELAAGLRPDAGAETNPQSSCNEIELACIRTAPRRLYLRWNRFGSPPVISRVADEHLIEEFSQFTAIIDPWRRTSKSSCGPYSVATIRTIRPTTSG